MRWTMPAAPIPIAAPGSRRCTTPPAKSAQIPWADLKPHPLLAAWLEAAAPAPGARALDVGCGLGDNAAGIAARGFRVTAFDLSPRAIAWARPRFPQVEFLAADLFAPPAQWNGAFDLVHECYTLQALPDAPRADAMRRIAQFVRPGGRLLVIARARDDGTPSSGPPWPLSRQELMEITAHGLVVEAVERLPDPTDGKSHWRAAFRRAEP